MMDLLLVDEVWFVTTGTQSFDLIFLKDFDVIAIIDV